MIMARWRCKQHFRQTFSGTNMLVQIILVFKDFGAVLTNVIGGLSVE